MSLKPDTLPEPWSSFLRALDELATGRVDFHCIGGFVVTRCFHSLRETRDVDVLSITPRTQSELFLQKAGEGSELHSCQRSKRVLGRSHPRFHGQSEVKKRTHVSEGLAADRELSRRLCSESAQVANGSGSVQTMSQKRESGHDNTEPGRNSH
jgi:hypothetical protein